MNCTHSTLRSKPGASSRGFSAIEVAIFMVAASVVATLSAVGLMALSGDAAEAGAQSVHRGLDHATGSLELRGPVIATRGAVDVDGNDVIDIAGVDIYAITTVKLLLAADLAAGVDLTPPYTANESQVDPDFSTAQVSTVVSVITERFNIASAAWTVSFPGPDNGDLVLDRGEQAEVTIWLHPLDVANSWYDLGSGVSDPFVDTANDAVVARSLLTVRITPDDAPELAIERTLPVELTSTVLLD